MRDPKSSKPRVSCPRNGPYVVRGLETITLADGTKAVLRRVTSLCRCGGSTNKPYCNGSHARTGFSSEVSPDRVPDRRDTYAGSAITIYDNRGLCSHAGYCTELLPYVFRSAAEPRVEPDGAPIEEIIRIIEKCPSGALSYAIDGIEHRDQERAAAIEITPHGPLRLVGGVELVGAADLEGASIEHRTLCRCGHSKNKPFCDGTHWHVGFRDDGLVRVALLSGLSDDGVTHVEVRGVPLAVSKRPTGATVRHAESGDELTVTVEPRWGEVFVAADDLRGLAARAPDADSAD